MLHRPSHAHRGSPPAAVLADYPRMGSLVKKVWADSNLSHRAPGVGCARCAAVLRTWTAFERQFWNDLEPDLNRVCLMLPDDLA